jgi:tRNA (guanine-N7-)-methyltransferase
MTEPAHPPLRSFGRIRSRSIKPAQGALMESLLPRIAIPEAAAGSLDPKTLMPGAERVVLEIGFGGGEHLAAQAQKARQTLFLGAEPFLNGVASALRHVDAMGLENVRLHAGDVRSVTDALKDGSLDQVFILFPDPWQKARHRKRRLLQPDFARTLARLIRPGGRLRFVTDWADYADQALFVLNANPDFDWQAKRADDFRRPPLDHVPTRYQEKRLGDIEPVYLDYVRV